MIGQTLGLLSGKTLETSDVLMVCLIGMVVVIVELALIAFCITGVSKAINGLTKVTKKKMKADANAQSAAPAQVSAPASFASPAQAVVVKKDPELIGVDEKSAAIIMAIVSDESGIPLERLEFKSIKKID